VGGAGAAAACFAGAGLALGVFFDLPVVAGSEGRAGMSAPPQPYVEESVPKTAFGSRCPSLVGEL
jgi:hypothetical protein